MMRMIDVCSCGGEVEVCVVASLFGSGCRRKSRVACASATVLHML
jgi:hypothetical protein